MSKRSSTHVIVVEVGNISLDGLVMAQNTIAGSQALNLTIALLLIVGSQVEVMGHVNGSFSPTGGF
jgi:hypothetical protein